jgi:serine-type D-Ala-D-Ala carboxypeptidase/endopeptidase (penicillin-binding protein 4)
MIPASNQKLLTAGAALHVLGPDFEFQTRLVLDDENLILVGDGDPTIGDVELLGLSDWSKENHVLDQELQPWVDAVKVAGIKEIKTLFVDDRIFDQNFVHPSWPANQINNWYCAQVSGLNYHLNVVHFLPEPRRGTTASLGDIAPRMKWISFGNKTTSNVGKKYKSSFWIARPPNTNKMTARGNVNATHKVPVKVAFHDPAIVFGNTFASLLRKNNISVRNVEHIPTGTKLAGRVIFTQTTPLQTTLQRSNTDSHNLYAESLLKRISAEATRRSGTFDEGATVVEEVISQRLNEAGRSAAVADGSGMSRENQISPRTLARWLASFDIAEPAGKSLLQSLATPGIGTLDNRFKSVDLGQGTVHAKSGYLSGVCSLSGYITFPVRDPLVFSIIVNDVKGTVKGAKKMQERIVSAAIQYGSEPH